MKQDDPQFKLRLPPGLKDLLESARAESGRTLGAEIVHRLEQSFNPEPGKPFDIGTYEVLKADILADVLKAVEARGKK